MNVEICTQAAGQKKQHAKTDWREEIVRYKAANTTSMLKSDDDADVKVWLRVA
jgi:hypothetical protein